MLGRAPTYTTVVDFDVLRDSRHKHARAAREQADWLSWLELGGIRPRTLDDYERWTAVLLRMFPSKAFDEFTDGDLVHVFKTFPVASRRIRMAGYRSWFKWGRQTRRITDNPMEYVMTPRRLQKPHVEIFSKEEQGRLEALPSPDGPLMSILFRTGIRRSEALRLQGRHIDLVRQRLNIVDGKGGKDRPVEFGNKLAVILDEFIILEGVSRDDYVWHSHPGGGRLQRIREPGAGVFGRWWARCTEQADVEYIPRDSKRGIKGKRNPHVTRHTYATNWLRKGGRLETLQQNLGHDSIATTKDFYGHLDAEDIRADLEIVEAED